MLSRALGHPRVLFWLVAAATAWMCATMPVFSQEAYYWTYAQHQDLSYFDHPPLVAWLIWFGTSVFGDGCFGLRFCTWLCGLGVTAFGAKLLRDFGIPDGGVGLWILLSVAAPILAMTHFLVNPDASLVCGWTLVMLAMWRARSGSVAWWIVAGVAAGITLLSKYSGAFLAISGVVLLACDPLTRRQLRRPGPYVAVLVAAVVFLPVVVWNVNNHFESFRFQTGERFSKGELGWRWLLQFAGQQLLIVHPVLGIAIAVSLGWLVRRGRADARIRWLLAFGMPLPVWFVVSSVWMQVKMNWLAPAFVPLLLGVAVWWSEHAAAVVRPRLARVAAASLMLVPAAMLLAPAMHLVPPGRGTTWSGWEEIAARAEVWEDKFDPEDGIEGNIFYFAADYRDAAQLGRQVLLQRRKERPLENGFVADPNFEPTLAQNVIGMRGLQFDHWSRPKDRIGQDAIFVLPRPEQRGAMVREASMRFLSMEKLERVQVCRLGVHHYDADIYVCRGYKGPDPLR